MDALLTLVKKRTHWFSHSLTSMIQQGKNSKGLAMFQGLTANVRNVSILKTLKIDGSLKWAPSMEALGSILEMKPKPKLFATGIKQDSSPGGRGTGGI